MSELFTCEVFCSISGAKYWVVVCILLRALGLATYWNNFYHMRTSNVVVVEDLCQSLQCAE